MRKTVNHPYLRVKSRPRVSQKMDNQTKEKGFETASREFQWLSVLYRAQMSIPHVSQSYLVIQPTNTVFLLIKYSLHPIAVANHMA